MLLSPIKSDSSLGSVSPVASPAGLSWRERDSGLSQSTLQGHGARDGQGEEMEKLVEECKTTLGVTAQDGAVSTTGTSGMAISLVHSQDSVLWSLSMFGSSFVPV